MSIMGKAAGFMATLTAVVGLSAAANARDLTVVSWGGAYQEVQKQVYFEPFKAPFPDGFATRIVATQPESRGAVKLDHVTLAMSVAKHQLPRPHWCQYMLVPWGVNYPTGVLRNI